jgi:hypothetical protein
LLASRKTYLDAANYAILIFAFVEIVTEIAFTNAFRSKNVWAAGYVLDTNISPPTH